MSPILRGNDGLGARALLTGHVGGCRGSSSTRSWQTVCFRPPQHMATVPSQCLINSCHSSHNQYRLISRVCVTLSLHRGSICNPRDRNETARVWKWKPQNYRLEKGANHTFLSPPVEFYFHNASAVDAFHLRNNRWEVSAALTRVVTAVKTGCGSVGRSGQICK